jgi:hypothetical protein
MFRNGDCEMGACEIDGIATSGYVEDLTADDVSEVHPAKHSARLQGLCIPGS